jgi:hypothetical protein
MGSPTHHSSSSSSSSTLQSGKSQQSSTADARAFQAAARAKDLHILSHMTYPIADVSSVEMVRVLLDVSKLNLRSDTDISDYCRLCMAAVLDQKCALDANALDTICRKHASLLENAFPESTRELLRSLSYLLKDNGDKCARFAPELVEKLCPYARMPASADEFSHKRLACKTLGVLCVRSSHKLAALYPSIFDCVYGEFLVVANEVVKGSVSADVVRILLTLCDSLSSVIAEARDVHVVHVPSIVSTCKNLITLCVAGREGSSSTQVSESDAESDSAAEASTTHSSFAFKLTPTSERIIIAVLALVSSMARTHNKSMYSQWPTLFPDHATLLASTSNPHLFSLLFHSSSVKVRHASANTICALLDKSRLFLATADDRLPSAHARFITRSQILGSYIREFHVAVKHILESHDVSHQSRKVVSTVIENCAYENLHNKYLSDLIPLLVAQIDRNPPEVLTALGACFSTKRPLEHVRALISEPLVKKIATFAAVPGSAGVAPSSASSGPVDRSEAVSCLARMCSTYAVHMARFYESCIVPYAQVPSVVSALTASGREALGMDTWTAIVMWVLSRLDADEKNSAAVSVLQNLSSDVYSQLDASLKRQLQLSLLARREQFHVLKVIGHVVLFSELRADSLFVAHVFDVVSSMSESIIEKERANRELAARCAWLLANLCDALSTSRDLDLALQCVTIAERMLDVHDKVRQNAVRALGHLASFLPADHAQPIVNRLLQTGAHAGCSAKTKWNICYALYNSGRNIQGSAESNEYLCSCLSDANWKVRIQAAQALTVHFANAKTRVWQVLLDELIPSAKREQREQSIRNLREYRYMQMLDKHVAHMFLTLATGSMDSQDEAIGSMLVQHIEAVCDYVRLVESQWTALGVVDDSRTVDKGEIEQWESRDPANVRVQDMAIVRRMPVQLVRACRGMVSLMEAAAVSSSSPSNEGNAADAIRQLKACMREE